MPCLARRHPFRWAAGWDGVYVGTTKGNGEVLTPYDLTEVIAYVVAHQDQSRSSEDGSASSLLAQMGARSACSPRWEREQLARPDGSASSLLAQMDVRAACSPRWEREQLARPLRSGRPRSAVIHGGRPQPVKSPVRWLLRTRHHPPRSEESRLFGPILEAGATWWLEGIWESFAEGRYRIQQGPPRRD